MHPRLISIYNDELHNLRVEAGEFADEYQSAADMLSLRQGRVRDPYVERLLEGVAYLAARVRLKLDAQYPVFTQQLMDILCPGWLAPSPSICVLQLGVDSSDESLANGPVVGRHSVVKAELKGIPGARCEFETAWDTRLWPLELAEVTYHSAALSVHTAGDTPVEAESCLRIELRPTAGCDIAALAIDRLPFYVAMPDPEGSHVLELLAGRCIAVGVSSERNPQKVRHWLPGASLRHVGFEESESAFRIGSRSHPAARVLREFAALPEKFRFVEASGLADAWRAARGASVNLHFLFSRSVPALESKVRKSSLALHCVPAVNLRERDLGRIHVYAGEVEYRIGGESDERRRLEPIEISKVVAGGAGFQRPVNRMFEVASAGRLSVDSFYSVRRVERRLTQKDLERHAVQLQGGAPAGSNDVHRSSSRPDTDLYIMLAESGSGPLGADLEYVDVSAWCMDRDIPMWLNQESALAHYQLIDPAPVASVKCLAGPSPPLNYALDGFSPWLVLSHLNVNHLSITGDNGADPAQALRSVLELFAPEESKGGKTHFLHHLARCIESVTSEQVTRRLPDRGELAFARGAHVTVKVTDRGLSGSSPFLLGAMIEIFLSSQASINSFVELELDLGHISQPLKWNRQPGRRPTL